MADTHDAPRCGNCKWFRAPKYSMSVPNSECCGLCGWPASSAVLPEGSSFSQPMKHPSEGTTCACHATKEPAEARAKAEGQTKAPFDRLALIQLRNQLDKGMTRELENCDEDMDERYIRSDWQPLIDKVDDALADPAAPSDADRKLRMYVWEGVLCDYTIGMMVALASSPEEARELLRKEMGGCSSIAKGDIDSEPKVVDSPAAFYVWGGG